MPKERYAKERARGAGSSGTIRTCGAQCNVNDVCKQQAPRCASTNGRRECTLFTIRLEWRVPSDRMGEWPKSCVNRRRGSKRVPPHPPLRKTRAGPHGSRTESMAKLMSDLFYCLSRRYRSRDSLQSGRYLWLIEEGQSCEGVPAASPAGQLPRWSR